MCLEMQSTDVGSKTSADDMEQQQQQQQQRDEDKEDADTTGLGDENADDGGNGDESSAGSGASQLVELITVPRDTGHDRDQMLTR